MWFDFGFPEVIAALWCDPSQRVANIGDDEFNLTSAQPF
jgi:hypothetical protein